MDGVSSTDDPVAVRVADTARRLVGEFTRGTSPGDVVAAARDLSAAAETALQTAVDRAWAAGRSWREIGDVLGISRQAAFQRFGHPVDPRTGEPMTRAVPPDAVERVTGFLARFTAGRWEEVLGDFNEFMRERHDVDRLASGWAHMIGMFGSYQGSGDVSPILAGDNTVADVLLRFEAGEAMLWIRFDRDGKVAGLRLHPASPLPGKERLTWTAPSFRSSSSPWCWSRSSSSPAGTTGDAGTAAIPSACRPLPRLSCPIARWAGSWRGAPTAGPCRGSLPCQSDRRPSAPVPISEV
jgi:hypothetical protein